MNDIDQTLLDKHPHLRLVFGEGVVAQVGELAREFGGEKVLLVTDPGIVAAGHADAVRGHLEAAGLGVSLFDQSKENPTSACIDDCARAAREAGVNFIIGLGGGSSMDTAKGANFILTNGGTMKDYWGVGKASQPMLPSLMIPTTAGTGSECQSFALISDNDTHQKMACGDPKAMAKAALLDPALTVSQPTRVTACTGVDAVAHAVETAVTRKRNEASLKYSREAFRLFMGSLSRALQNPGDLEARGRMLLGAALAGTAIEHSMLGAAHSAANPLTAHFDVIHGQAVGMMLPHVIRFNAVDEAAAAGYADLIAGTPVAPTNGTASAEALAQEIETSLDTAGLPRALADCGVQEAMLDTLSEEAAQQWTASFNPRDITAADFAALYQKAFTS